MHEGEQYRPNPPCKLICTGSEYYHYSNPRFSPLKKQTDTRPGSHTGEGRCIQPQAGAAG